jgi:hypothetical protein
MKKNIIPILIIVLGVIVLLVTRRPAPVVAPSPVEQAPAATTVPAQPGDATPRAEISARELIEDSRCPVDVTCIQAGTVKVRAHVTVGSQAKDIVFELGKAQTVLGKTITMTTVTPERHSGTTIQFAEYRFTFSVQG